MQSHRNIKLSGTGMVIGVQGMEARYVRWGVLGGVRDGSDFEDCLQRVAERLKIHVSNESHHKF